MADILPLSIRTKPRLPTEVCERIIEAMWDSRYALVPASLATLSSCALVCRDWRPRAQRVLFEYVILRDTDALYRFSELLDASPELGSYVRTLALRGYLRVPSSPVVLLPTILRGRLTHLRALALYGVDENEQASRPLPEGRKEHPVIPIHRKFPSLLKTISHVRRLDLAEISLPSFGDFVRILNTLSKLEELNCSRVSWIILGKELPCMARNRPHDFRNTFLPNLRTLECYDMEEKGRQRLISGLGPSLQKLLLKVPNEPPSTTTARKERSEDKVSLALDLTSLPNLRDLIIRFAPLPQDTRLTIQSLQNTLSSWAALGDGPLSDASTDRERHLCLPSYWRRAFTRTDFVHLLRTIGPVVEAALCVNNTEHDVGDNGGGEPEKQVDPCHATLIVENLGDRTEWEAWWEEQVSECFPTSAQWKHLTVRTSHNNNPTDLWKDHKQAPQDLLQTPRQVLNQSLMDEPCR